MPDINYNLISFQDAIKTTDSLPPQKDPYIVTLLQTKSAAKTMSTNELKIMVALDDNLYRHYCNSYDKININRQYYFNALCYKNFNDKKAYLKKMMRMFGLHYTTEFSRQCKYNIMKRKGYSPERLPFMG